MPYRLIYVGLALLGLAVVILGIVLTRSGEEIILPSQLESISPSPGSLVPPQTSIEVDLPVGYEAEIVIDGWPITDATFVDATGVYRWAPSENSPVIQDWTAGRHTVRVTWDTYTGLPDPGSFEWTFRVG